MKSLLFILLLSMPFTSSTVGKKRTLWCGVYTYCIVKGTDIEVTSISRIIDAPNFKRAKAVLEYHIHKQKLPVIDDNKTGAINLYRITEDVIVW